MSFWSRIGNAFGGNRLNREIDEEFAAHMDEAIAAGDDPLEVRRTFGSALRLREQSRTPASPAGSTICVPTWSSAGASC